MKPVRAEGQALVEAALIFPVLLLLLAGAYVACRTVFLHSAAESAAHAEALRAGRHLPGIEPQMADSIIPGGRGVTIRTERGKTARLLPSPFPALAGRTPGIADIRTEPEPLEEIAGFAAPPITRTAEISVDCWGKGSPSGNALRNAVLGIIAVGTVR